MMITIIIYSFIILYIIGRGFYISRKPLCNVQNRESFQDSISLSAMPFYSNMGRINLFAFFINFFIISFISINLLPDLISNNIAFCQDLYSDNGGSFERETKLYIKNNLKWGQNMESDIYKNNPLFLDHNSYIDNFYKVSNQKYPFIFHLNGDLKINAPLKVYEGLTEDFYNMHEEQKILLKNIKNKYEINLQDIHKKNLCLMKLTSVAYNKLIFLSKDNSLFKNYNLNYQIKNLNKEAFELSAYLESINDKSNRGGWLYVADYFLEEKRSLLLKKFDLKESRSFIKYPNDTWFDSERLYNTSKPVLKPEGNKDNHAFIYRNINSFYEQFKDLNYYKANKDSLKAIKDMGFNPKKKYNFDRNFYYNF